MLTRDTRSPPYAHLVIGVGIVLATVAILLLMGRSLICTCGEVKLWVSDIASADNSQQIADWYSLTHIVHGLAFFAVLAVVAGRLQLRTRALIALALAAAWEIGENTDAVIKSYREETLALGYVGDSVLNTVTDLGFVMLGFYLAYRLPVWASVALLLGLELGMLLVIRDNVTLNILMLLHPIDAIRDWQMQGWYGAP